MISFFTTSYSEEQTEEFGKTLAESIREGDIVCLSGDLGAGKTCLARGLVAGLQGGYTVPVKSPSYTILNIYEGDPVIHHFDFYRLHDQGDISELGLDDYWGKGICIVEWPGSNCSSLPYRKVNVDMAIMDDGGRRISVKIL